MEQLWQQLLQALTHLFPDLRHSLRAGVSEQAVREVEQQLDVVFSEELYTHFRLHNGSIDPLFGSWTLLSLEDMYKNWHILRRKAEEDQQLYQESLTVPRPFFSSEPLLTQRPLWHKTWLPLLHSGRLYREYKWLVLDAALPFLEDDPLAESNEGAQRLFYYPPLEDHLTCPT